MVAGVCAAGRTPSEVGRGRFPPMMGLAAARKGVLLLAGQGRALGRVERVQGRAYSNVWVPREFLIAIAAMEDGASKRDGAVHRNKNGAEPSRAHLLQRQGVADLNL